jgi:hypothetical protein
MAVKRKDIYWGNTAHAAPITIDLFKNNVIQIAVLCGLF